MLQELIAKYPNTHCSQQRQDTIKRIYFDPKHCSLYSGNFRFCFETNRGRIFSTDVDVCLSSDQNYWKQTSRHRWKQVKEAFRYAIADQIDEVKQTHFATSKVQMCPYTWELYTLETCHVDHGLGHDQLSFDNILNQFLTNQAQQADIKEPFQLVPRGSNKVKPTPLSEYGRKQLFIQRIELQGPPYQLVDDKLRLAWQEFHQSVARLRVVSRRANLFFGKKAEKESTTTELD